MFRASLFLAITFWGGCSGSQPSNDEPLDHREQSAAPGPAFQFAPGEEALPPPVEAQPLIARQVTTPQLTNTQNYLLLGLDSLAGRRATHSDTIMLAVLDPESHHVGLVSIPRDLYVAYPDYGMERLASAPVVGRLTRTPWIPLLKRVLTDTLGVEIHHHVVIDLAGFERAIDDLGGVDVRVPCAMRDDFVDPRTDNGRRILSVEPGLVRMNGVTAAMYARSRHGRSDWDRARRQQAILLGVRARVEDPTNLLGTLAFAEQVYSMVETDLGLVDAIGLARQVGAFRMENLHGAVLGHHAVEGFVTERGQHVLLPIPAEIERTLQTLFEAPSPGERLRNSRCAPVDAALRPRRSDVDVEPTNAD